MTDYADMQRTYTGVVYAAFPNCTLLEFYGACIKVDKETFEPISVTVNGVTKQVSEIE